MCIKQIVYDKKSNERKMEKKGGKNESGLLRSLFERPRKEKKKASP